MDHNGSSFYTDLDSLNSITNLSSTTNNNFNDSTCTILPSLNNFKYQQTNLATNIYQQPVQQQTIPDHQQQQHHNHSTSTKHPQTQQTQININNCNNNIFFPHDDGIFDANPTPSCASTVPNTNNSSGNSNPKNNFIGYVRKVESGASGGGDNITYNINNINTNIVNNINNPTNLVNSTDIFGSNQYHQINKNAETIINFNNNNNLNTGNSNSMPTDSVSATSQNFYGYQANSHGQQQTVYETSIQSQSQSSSTYIDPLDPTILSAGVPKAMGTTGTGLYHGSHPQSNVNQTMPNGASYLPGNNNTIPTDHSAQMDPFSEYPESLSTAAKIINNFESKNPLKYSTASTNRIPGNYYKSATEFPNAQYTVNHLPPPGHNYGFHPNGGLTKVPQHAHSYDPYARLPRNTVPHYQTGQHYPNTANAHPIDESLPPNSNRINYNRTSGAPISPYHHPHALPPHPNHHPSNYGSYFNNTYNAMPYSSYPQLPTHHPQYANAQLRNDSCSKTSQNYNKSLTMSPVEHGNFSMVHHGANYTVPPKKVATDFYTENHYFQPAHQTYYEDPGNHAFNSCAKKANSRPKVSTDMYNPNGATTIYSEHPMPFHHQPNGNVIRNISYQQPMPKHYGSVNPYPLPNDDPYYHYKNSELAKMAKINPALSSKQFKSYGHYEMPPHPHNPYVHPQYHTMHAKRPEKLKLSIDLEEQINSSKIPKMREIPPHYGFEMHHPHPYYQYHHVQQRNIPNETDKNSATNINISLRDFLSTWNDGIDEDEETNEKRHHQNAILDDFSEHMERTIMREYNPMFVQKATDGIMSATDVPSNGKSELDNGIVNDGTEKLYVLESIDVPLSELNKYKHLNVINKLPENVVITDKELYPAEGGNLDASMKFNDEIDREKFYKSFIEMEFEACQQEKKIIAEPIVEKEMENIPSIEEKPNEPEKSESDEKSDSQRKKVLKAKSPKLKSEEVKMPKVKQKILKLKKEKILKVTSKDPRKVSRITKRMRRYSLNQRVSSSVKSLQSICVDFINTSAYRNYAREQLSISKKFSKMRILKDFKKKFNFDSSKRTSPAINQKLNHSVRINSLKEICDDYLQKASDDEGYMESSDDVFHDDFESCVPSLRDMCQRILRDMDINVVQNYAPLSLKEICEGFIYNNSQYFVIEEVSHVPKLQELCRNILSETNIFINVDEEGNNIYALNEDTEAIQSASLGNNESANDDSEEPIYIVEENSGCVAELFESSENMDSFEKSEILRKIQRVANNLEDDDEIFRAIGALHCESITNNNNSSGVYNKNINHINGNLSAPNEFTTTNDETKCDSAMSFLCMDHELMHSVQYEETIAGNKGEKTRKIIEILRYKYLNRSDDRQKARSIIKLIRSSLRYQRQLKFFNAAKRRKIINNLKKQARAVNMTHKHSQSNCPTKVRTGSEIIKCQRDADNESQSNAKINVKTQSHQISQPHEALPIIKMMTDGDKLSAHVENNFPKLPSVFPSINEYKIDRKSSNRCDSKDKYDNKKHRMNFEESLLSIEKMYAKSNEDEAHRDERRHYRQSPSRHQHRSRDRRDDHYHERRHRHHRSRSTHYRSSRSSRSSSERETYRKSYHNSSRNTYNNNNNHNHSRRDQTKHSEVRRLVIPSSKLYDKDLDVKLKIRPYVRIEREEKVDDMVKKYN